MNTQQKIYAFFKKQEDAATRAPYSKIFGRKAVQSSCIWYKWIEQTDSFEINVLPWTINPKTGQAKASHYNTPNAIAPILHVGPNFLIIPTSTSQAWQRRTFVEYSAKTIGAADIRTMEFHSDILYLDGAHYHLSSGFTQRDGKTNNRSFTPYTLAEATAITKELFNQMRINAAAYFSLHEQNMRDAKSETNFYDVLDRFAVQKTLSAQDYVDLLYWYNNHSKAGYNYSDMKKFAESFVNNGSMRRWIISYYMNHPKWGQ